MPAPNPWLITDLTPEVIKALDGSIQTGLGRDGSRLAGPAVPTAPEFTVSKTANSITAVIASANGADSYEFSVNGTAWASGVTVSGLTPATAYNFRGRGINSAGTGPSSAVVAVTTNAAVVSNDAWQSVLESNFMRADSFDDTEDWQPAVVGNYATTDLPVRTNGAPSIWGRFTGSPKMYEVSNASGPLPSKGSTLTFSGGESSEYERAFSENGRDYIMAGYSAPNLEAIGQTITAGEYTATVIGLPSQIGNDHPVYRNRGKSLCINYDNFSGGINGFGPARMTTYFGELGNSASGLKKVHIFWMMYVDPAFFEKKPDTDEFELSGVHKIFDLCTGHVAVNDFGSASEKLEVNSSGQLQREYGPNYTIGTTKTGGSISDRITLNDNARKAVLQSDGLYGKTDVYNPPYRRLADGTRSTDITPYVLNNTWFGMEYAYDVGTVDTPDGTVDLWVYDEAGNEVGSFSVSGLDNLVHFDHKYNLFTLGGNRICEGYGKCPIDAHSRMYVDDFVLDSVRIGPTYFQLLTNFEGPL